MKANAGATAATSLWLGAVLALAAFALMVVPVLAPALVAESGLPAAFVGAYSAAVWAAAIVSSLASPGLLIRFGAWRLSQGCLLLCAAGVVAVLGGGAWGLAAGALLIGLGHGLEGPAAAQLLSAHVPAARQPLWFSIKQTGVQVGAVLASAALPVLALLAGWRAAALLAAALAVAGVLLLAVPRRRYPLPHGVAVAGPGLGALVLLRRSPVLRSLALAAAAFGAVQVCLNSFFVSFAVAERGATLVDAGRWLAAAQGGGLVGRLLWGWVGLRPGSAIPLVASLGLGMAVCSATLSLWDVSTAAWVMWPLAAVFGLTASGWNGLFLAEVARQSPAQQAGAATAGVMVVMTMGLVVGPLVFSAVASASTFALAFGVLAGVSMAGVAALAMAHVGSRTTGVG